MKSLKNVLLKSTDPLLSNFQTYTGISQRENKAVYLHFTFFFPPNADEYEKESKKYYSSAGGESRLVL